LSTQSSNTVLLRKVGSHHANLCLFCHTETSQTKCNEQAKQHTDEIQVDQASLAVGNYINAISFDSLLHDASIVQEQTDMRINLTNNREIAIEEQM